MRIINKEAHEWVKIFLLKFVGMASLTCFSVGTWTETKLLIARKNLKKPANEQIDASYGCLSKKLFLRIAVLHADNASADVRTGLAIVQRQILNVVQIFARGFRVARLSRRRIICLKEKSVSLTCFQSKRISITTRLLKREVLAS